MREEETAAGMPRGQRPRVRWDFFNPDERRFAILLDALASWNAREEMVELERNAAPTQSMGHVAEQEQELAEEQVEAAREELGVFRDALRQAYRARTEAPGYDSADPVQDRQAGVLINYLVRTDHAQVRTEELGDQRYRYSLDIDWPRLQRLAARHDLDLDSMLA